MCSALSDTTSSLPPCPGTPTCTRLFVNPIWAALHVREEHLKTVGRRVSPFTETSAINDLTHGPASPFVAVLLRKVGDTFANKLHLRDLVAPPLPAHTTTYAAAAAAATPPGSGGGDQSLRPEFQSAADASRAHLRRASSAASRPSSTCGNGYSLDAGVATWGNRITASRRRPPTHR